MKYEPLEIAALRWLKSLECEKATGFGEFHEAVNQATHCTQEELHHVLKMLNIEGLVTYKFDPSIPRTECSITRDGLLALRTI